MSVSPPAPCVSAAPRLLSPSCGAAGSPRDTAPWGERRKEGGGGFIPPPLTPLVPPQSYLKAKAMDHYQLLDLLGKMLQYEPTERLSLSSALSHPFFLPPVPQKRYSQLWEGVVVAPPPPALPSSTRPLEAQGVEPCVPWEALYLYQ